MQQSEFVAWSLYTGPSNLQSIFEGSSWVMGQWDAINNDTSAPEIKMDIDRRIDIVIETFQQTLNHYKTYNRFFIIPEFFFRCKQGPYPNVKVDDVDYPVEYIQKTLKERFNNTIPQDNNYYNIFIGSILTSNIEDYNQFLESEPVKERLHQLNSCLKVSKHHLLNSSSSKRSAAASWHREIAPIDKKRLFVSANNEAANSAMAINNFMKEARANPLCTVRNRGIYFQYNRTMMQEVDTFICEKQYESTVDLTMGIFKGSEIDHGGMITEWMANYPSKSILGGDKQTDEFSTDARFSPRYLGSMDIGVEICLDHRKQRLRRTVDMSKVNGADADNYPLIHQIISSGGMQILDYAVAADSNCSIFNADGCDKIYGVYGDESTAILNGEAGKFKGITTGVYNKSVQSKWQGKDGQTYYSHSQLAFTTNESRIEGFDNALGLNNKKNKTYSGTALLPTNILTDRYEPQVFNRGLNEPTDLFGATTGELHYYSDVSNN